jgi:hypothetical protein
VMQEVAWRYPPECRARRRSWASDGIVGSACRWDMRHRSGRSFWGMWPANRPKVTVRRAGCENQNPVTVAH